MTAGLIPLPFDEAIAFFRDKVVLPPDKYAALTSEAKAKAFSVSGVARMDVLADLFGAMEKALAQGASYGDFKKAVRGTMERRGWGGMEPHRLDTIFRTNMQSAYQAGHYQQLSEAAEMRPYWQYVAVMDSRVRPAHAAMNGKVFRHDDPFWQRNFPPNGFNCRCTVRSLSEREMKREELAVSENGPEIADKGFDFNPGATMGIRIPDDQFGHLQSDPDRWTPLLTKNYADYGLPPARQIRDYMGTETALWPRGQKAVALYGERLAGKMLTDAVNDPLMLNDTFIRHLALDGREQYLPLIEEIVAYPRELWLQAEREKLTGKIVLRKRYVAFVDVGLTRRLVLVAEAAKGQWMGYTIIAPSNLNYIDNIRNGVLLNE